ncbi:DUF397 domain-containing protein [Streptomyces sp. SID5785]|uniref:DUF397 domain-containing protein n=1 Tax=Streptomyces sp. SID5785 TaxID=2690309 RepID=UPI001360BD14|nr:DUF397 domain-containing protein [Streptomyces sp. SID5785]
MNTELAWFKSSYSNNQGEACLEVAYASGTSGRDGVTRGTGASVAPRTVHVRDSKTAPSAGPSFRVGAEAWTSFTRFAARG